MAYKLFSTGEVLTAANVNNYLMNQTVMVFASAAARTTALSGVLAEGMISYRTDSHILEYYTGSTWSAVSSSIITQGLSTHPLQPTPTPLPLAMRGYSCLHQMAQRLEPSTFQPMRLTPLLMAHKSTSSRQVRVS